MLVGDEKVGGKAVVQFPSLFLSFPSGVLWKWLHPNYLLERLEGVASTDIGPFYQLLPQQW